MANPGYPPYGGQQLYPMPEQNYPQGPGYPQPGYPGGPAGYPQPGYPGEAGGYPPPGNYGPPHQGGYGPPQGNYGPPIVSQPMGGGGWMNMPQGPPNCPPGLEYLTMIDQLLVHQKVELLEAITGFETKNKFMVKNSIGQDVYYCVEDSDCLTRNCCGPIRPFGMKILDNYRNQVMYLSRPLACDSCCFPCCLQKMEVTAPPGTLVGTVQQEWSILRPLFTIRDANDQVIFKIIGPICTMRLCSDVEFKVYSADESTVVGKISKQWAGLIREAFTDTDYFGITFPMDLDVRMKAVMLGACMLIDAMFFERTEN